MNGGLRAEGSLLEWKCRYGWICPDEPVDHPEAGKHNGRIFLSVSDIGTASVDDLVAGTRLSFGLYADGNGIGAEKVDVRGSTRASPASRWNVQKTIAKKTNTGSSFALSKGKPVALSAGKGKGAREKGGKGSCFGGPNRDKSTHSGETLTLRWASTEMQGWRPAMEDAVCARLEMPSPLESFALFGVFDGHGGAKVSAFVAEKLPQGLVDAALQGNTSENSALAQRVLEVALPALDEELLRDGDGEEATLPGSGILSDVRNAYGLMGSTAVVAMLECDGTPAYGQPTRVVVANLGDSRAALCRGGVAVELTEDHKPDHPVETARIEAAGGFVAAVGPCQRIDGWGLNLSRALGDFHYKARADLSGAEQKVSNMPDVRSEEITEDDEFLFLGCDGCFELHSTQEVIDIARASLLAGKSLGQATEELVDACCSPDLLQTCGQGADNVSAMIVLLRQDWPAQF